MSAAEPDGNEPAPPAPRRARWPVVGAAVAAVLVAYATILGIFADAASVFSMLGVVGHLTFIFAALGGGWLYWLSRTAQLPDLYNQFRQSGRIRWNLLLPAVSLMLALVMGISWIVVGGPTTGSGIAAAPGPVPAAEQVQNDGCSEPVTETLVHMSHLAYAIRTGEDSGIDVRPGGYVEQRFVAASAQIASIAVIKSRPGTEGPFDPNHVGRLRLNLYRVDDQADHLETIPLEQLGDDGPATADGIVMDAGENHKQAVFRFCPVRMVPGERYAFRVTNETERVILAFSLNVNGNDHASMDIVGEIHGADRRRINYFQVSGYVCSLASC